MKMMKYDITLLLGSIELKNRIAFTDRINKAYRFH